MKKVKFSFEKALIIKNEYIKESELEFIVVQNIDRIEKGLKYLASQYRVRDGVIDVMARDRKGVLCIIELKNDVESFDLIAQCIYYPLQFKEETRMIAICPDYTEKMKTIIRTLKHVEMKKYYFSDKNIEFLNVR